MSLLQGRSQESTMFIGWEAQKLVECEMEDPSAYNERPETAESIDNKMESEQPESRLVVHLLVIVN